MIVMPGIALSEGGVPFGAVMIRERKGQEASWMAPGPARKLAEELEDLRFAAEIVHHARIAEVIDEALVASLARIELEGGMLHPNVIEIAAGYGADVGFRDGGGSGGLDPFDCSMILAEAHRTAARLEIAQTLRGDDLSTRRGPSRLAQRLAVLIGLSYEGGLMFAGLAASPGW